METHNYDYEEPIGESVIVKLDHSFGSKILTNFYRTAARFNSPLINYVQYHQLFKGELRVHKPPLLLMRATRDGFEEGTFHNLCDDQGQIVIIVKSKKGDLFGGFASETLKHDERGSNVRDDKSFTFRFDDNRFYTFKLLPDDAIHTLYRYSSTYLFAFGYCFWLCHNANTSTLSSSHNDTENHILAECRLPKKETIDQYDDELPNTTSEEKRQYYGGYNFLVEDFEVYKIID